MSERKEEGNDYTEHKHMRINEHTHSARESAKFIMPRGVARKSVHEDRSEPLVNVSVRRRHEGLPNNKKRAVSTVSFMCCVLSSSASRRFYFPVSRKLNISGMNKLSE